MNDDFLFVNKYAPSTIEECILPKAIKMEFLKFRDTLKIPNLILHGTSGIGKTAVVYALSKELKVDFMKINGSNEGRSIDTIRNRVSSYASTVSLSNQGKKILLIDEADNLTFDAQKALLGVIEETQGNCIYVFTCNYVNKMLPAIHSRAAQIHFSIPSDERPKLAFEFFQKIVQILNNEKIKFEEKVLIEFIQRYFPDFRRTLNQLQSHTASGELTISSLGVNSNSNINELVSYLKDSNFREVRRWAALNASNDMSSIFRSLYDELPKILAPRTIPALIIILGEYQYKSNFVVDQEINLMACLSEILGECEFK